MIENPLVQQRLEKLNKLRDAGVDPYPPRCVRTHTIGLLLANEEDYLAAEQAATVSGRIVALRRHGKIGFANVKDETGVIQAYVRIDGVGETSYEVFKLLDLGDFVEIGGTMFRTTTGEYSIKADSLKILAKAVRPMPVVKEKTEGGEIKRFDEFQDTELRFRKRYLDLQLNPGVRDTFIARAKIMSEIRRFLDGRGFIEVETPILQPLYGGANARPFITHHNTLDIDLYLRIATELYLKRMIIGGLEKVYEVGKVFRNEGMDRTHNPEFTLLELYQAFGDLHSIMALTEDLIRHLANCLQLGNGLTFDEHVIRIDEPFRRVSMCEAVMEKVGFDPADKDADFLRDFAKQKGVEFEKNAGKGKMIETLFGHFVEPTLIQPTFVTDYPLEISPLAKKKPDNQEFVERFELFIAGHEYANAFTELNDPLDQRERLENQARLRELGDLEANVVDEDFLEAMEYGMPPTGGLGIGIDRLSMLLTNTQSIKEIILFPQMKPE